METLEMIRSRIHIGNMQTAYGLLGKPAVFYVGSGGKGTYAPPDHPEKVVAYNASPLRNPFPVHRRDGKPLLDSLGEPIQTYSPEESVDKYSVWLDEKLTKKDKQVVAEINKMANALMQHKQIALICWCKMFSQDGPCHGDVIKDIVARTIDNHLSKGKPIATEEGYLCRACHHKFTFTGPLYEARCGYCGSPVVWDKPLQEEVFELEVEEEPVPDPPPKAIIDMTETDHRQTMAQLDHEVTTLERIKQYLEATHRDAMAHAVKPGAIDLHAHDQAVSIWKDCQAITNKLDETQAQLIAHARFLIQP